MIKFSLVFVGVGIMLGIINAILCINREARENDFSNICGEITGVVDSTVIFKGSIQQFDLTEVEIASDKKIIRMKHGIRMSAPLFPEVNTGDIFRTNACIDKSEYWQYQLALRQKGLGYISIARAHMVENNVSISYKNRFIRKTVRIIESNFSEPYASILLGTIWGIKRIRGGAWEQKILKCGLLYIFSVSGYQLFIISNALNKILAKFFKRIFVIIIILPVLYLYGNLSDSGLGFNRAFFIIFLIYLGQVLGRPILREVIIVFVIALLLVGNVSVYSQQGFQLSVLSTIGVVVLSPFIINLFSMLKNFNWFFLPLSIQLIIFPIIAHSYGSISVLSIFSGAIVSIVVSYIIIGGIIISLLSDFSIVVALIKIILTPLLFFIDLIIDIFSKIPFGFYEIEVSKKIIYFYYIILGLLYLMLNNDEN